MKNHIFIINPEAGKKQGPNLKGYIKRNYSNAIILLTQYSNHASELAQKYAAPDTILYAVGGDGTLNEVVNGVIASDYAMETMIASVPFGSGNDFIKGLTDIKDPMLLLEKYKRKKTKLIDVGLINGKSFVNISSVGFDAEIVLNAKKYKQLPLISAQLAYLISVFTTLLQLKEYKVTVSIDDGQETETGILFLTMANGTYYGGGMKAAPNAIIDDGLLDFCLVDKVKRREVPFLLPQFIKGKHEHLKMIHMSRGKTMTITSSKPLPLNLDGEVILSKQIQITLKNRAIRVLIP